MKHILKLLTLIVFAFLITSCNEYKRITYLQNIDEYGQEFDIKAIKETYKVQTDDILYIQINSLFGNANDVFETQSRNNQQLTMLGGFYLLGFTINPEGNIILPTLGSINVAGKTVQEIEDILQNEASNYVKDPEIKVRFVSYRFTVLGEVKSPGKKIVYEPQINIFEALGLAGDLNQYANRKNVLIIRNFNGKEKQYRLDLTDKNIFESPSFYIYPNDFIYVEPDKKKTFFTNISEYTYLLTTITSTLSVLALILSLK